MGLSGGSDSSLSCCFQTCTKSVCQLGQYILGSGFLYQEYNYIGKKKVCMTAHFDIITKEGGLSIVDREILLLLASSSSQKSEMIFPLVKPERFVGDRFRFPSLWEGEKKENKLRC